MGAWVGHQETLAINSSFQYDSVEKLMNITVSEIIPDLLRFRENLL